MYQDLHEECGVMGVYAPGQDVARIAFFGLHALQHRGQESAGISTGDGTKINLHTSMGLVFQAFRERDLESLKGHIAVGHTRYSTTGSNRLVNAQPIVSKGTEIEIALAHNGNVINALDLKEELSDIGYTFSGSTDSEIIAHLITSAPAGDWQERMSYCMRRLKGAYSLIMMTKNTLVAARDPLGVRPLCIGKLDDGGWVIASESCALDHVGAKYLRQIEPGETVTINEKGLKSFQWAGVTEKKATCIFEIIYFARPDSLIDNNLVYTSRMAMGRELAKEYPVEADMVIGVPDSAVAAAVGYSQESNIPYGEGLLKNRYVGRTFIQPDQRLREMGVRLKFNPLKEMLEGKRIIVVDDSIVRGTTTPHVVKLLKKSGAKEVHFRVCAPPIMWPCHFGVDLATRKELIAANYSVEQIREFVGADTLGYLSHEGLLKAVNKSKSEYCMACFTGDYPVPVQLEMDKLALEN